MQRFNFAARAATFNRMAYYHPGMSFRKQVLAGETSAFDLDIRIESDAVWQLRVPALFTHHLFYVPFRLCWDGWEDFFAYDGSGLSLPVTNTAFSFMGEASVGSKVALPRRAWKLVYNQFFGDEDVGSAGNAWYDDPFDDTDVLNVRLRNATQVLGEIMDEGAIGADNFLAPVSGANATIDLLEFDRRQRQRKSNTLGRVTGTKYTDSLARMGVRVNEALISEPELLSSKSSMIFPNNVRVSSDVGTGDRVGFYDHRLSVKVPSRFFAEAGIVIGIIGVRPLLYVLEQENPMETYLYDRANYYIDGVERRYIAQDRRVFTTDGEPDPVMVTGFQTVFGEVRRYNQATGTMDLSGASLNSLRYPVTTDHNSNEIDIECHSVARGKSPASPRFFP